MIYCKFGICQKKKLRCTRSNIKYVIQVQLVLQSISATKTMIVDFKIIASPNILNPNKPNMSLF